MEEYSISQTLSSVNDDPSVKFKHELDKHKQVIKNLLQDLQQTRQKLEYQIEELQRKRDLIRAEAKRWKQEYKSMSKKFNAVSEISAARLDMIDNLCDEIKRLDEIVYHKPF